MLPDLSLSNLFLENLGATFENLLNLANLVIYNRSALTFENLAFILDFLHIWPSQATMASTIDTVLFIVYSNDNYWKTLSEVHEVIPYLYALDYLHVFYVRQLVYKTFIEFYSNSHISNIKSLTIYMPFDILFSNLMNKWGYALAMFGITYYLTNLLKVRYQYGANFYFTYFKTAADLGEQEYGSYDDYKFFVFLLVQILAWYCWVFFIGYTFFLQSQSTLLLMTVSIMVTILTIPVRLLWDFGLAFGMYVRGAASSSNLVAEAFFDVIGVIIIFTRFIVQNIRFLLVFVAFFELFEWTFSATETMNTLKLSLDICNNLDFWTTFDSTAFLMYVVTWIKILFIYVYHLLHLIIVSFMQIGVYLMVSFWLFFFLYTSFFKLTTDSYFSVKRN